MRKVTEVRLEGDRRTSSRIVAACCPWRIVEEFVAKPIDAELARWAVGIAKRDYRRYLREVADIALDRPLTPPTPPRVRVLD